jgi:hypothetical protein
MNNFLSIFWTFQNIIFGRENICTREPNWVSAIISHIAMIQDAFLVFFHWVIYWTTWCKKDLYRLVELWVSEIQFGSWVRMLSLPKIYISKCRNFLIKKSICASPEYKGSICFHVPKLWVCHSDIMYCFTLEEIKPTILSMQLFFTCSHEHIYLQ